jgi:hypothetical protein
MTNFTKKQAGEAQVHIGHNQARLSRTTGASMTPTKKGKRKSKLHLGAAAARNLIEGTMKKNQNTDDNN